MGSQEWEVGSQDLVVGSQELVVGSQQWGVGSQEWEVGSQEWEAGSLEEMGDESQNSEVRSQKLEPALTMTMGKYCLKWTQEGEQTFADVSIKGTLTSEELQYSSTSSLFTSRSPSRSCNNTAVLQKR